MEAGHRGAAPHGAFFCLEKSGLPRQGAQGRLGKGTCSRSGEPDTALHEQVCSCPKTHLFLSGSAQPDPATERRGGGGDVFCAFGKGREHFMGLHAVIRGVSPVLKTCGVGRAV